MPTSPDRGAAGSSGIASNGDHDPRRRITLAVVTRDRASLLARYLLDGIREVVASGFDVVVVDQSVGEDTARLVLPIAGARYLRSSPGLSVGRNVAVVATRTPLVAFTDDDVSISPGWLDALLGAFCAVPDAGAVCGRGISDRGAVLPGARPGVYRGPTDPFTLGSGFNLAFRTAALAGAGPFDEQLGAGGRFAACEDTDMLYRMMKAGWAVVCSDDITVVHHGWRSPGQQLRLHFGYGLGTGAQAAKHLAAGDVTVLRFALLRAGRKLAAALAALLGVQPRVAAVQLAFVAGMATGFASRLRSARSG